MLTEPAHTVAICAPAVTQAAALAAYTGPQECVAEMRATYDERRRFMAAALDEMGLRYIGRAPASTSSPTLPAPA